MSDLTIKQEHFAQKYVELGNASEAYRQAYDADDMNPEAIHVEACRLSASPNVALRIERLEEQRLKRHAVTADRAIVEMAKIAFADIRKAFDENGNLKPIGELDDDTASAIAGLEVQTERTRGEDETITHTHKLKLNDKRAALDSLFKHLGLFTEKVELTGKNGAPLSPPAVHVYLPTNGRD